MTEGPAATMGNNLVISSSKPKEDKKEPVTPNFNTEESTSKEASVNKHEPIAEEKKIEEKPKVDTIKVPEVKRPSMSMSLGLKNLNNSLKTLEKP